MKCPRCKHPKMMKFGFTRGVYIIRRLYKCKKCNKRVSELIPEKSKLDWIKSDEYTRRMSYAQQLRYREATPEEKVAWSKTISEGQMKKHASKPPKKKARFIGMLGDIEVYATNFGRVGRKPHSASSKWARLGLGKPELKVKKPT